MNLFIVIFQDPIAHDWQQSAGPVLDEDDVFVISPYELIVRLHTGDPSFLAQAFNLHGEGTEPVVGAVFKLNGTYYGYHRTALWEWMAAATKDAHVYS